MGTTGQVETGRVADRRPLRFARLDDVLADAEALATAERAGRLRRSGNWTLGQTLGHIAGWVGLSFDGMPFKPPFFIRWMLRPMKRRFLFGSMPPGRRIPRVEGGTLSTDVMPTEEGLTRLRQAFARLQAGPPSLPHMLFGRLTHEEWINAHLRHAELHLSFFRVE